jgi:N-acetylmuramoyl-L-alanine amidase
VKTVILDAGHGGILNGEYQTDGKRSPEWYDGQVLYEGEFNRAILHRLVDKLNKASVPVKVVSDYTMDYPLEERVYLANDSDPENSFYISIHSNAGGGSGCEFYTSIGDTGADPMAEVFYEVFKHRFSTYPLRTDKSDGDSDKEDNFYVLRNTRMPAVLLELFFMDNEFECRGLLLTESGRDSIANAVFEAIMIIQEEC